MLALFRRLSADQRQTLLEFAEFLGQRGAGPALPLAEPQAEPRPQKENVVAAIRRLRRVYPMLDRDVILAETSALMAAHLLQGRSAEAVIDELEALFERHYRNLAGGSDV